MQVTITYLQRNGSYPCQLLPLPDGYKLHHEESALPSLFRQLYYEVGENNFWWERRLWSDNQWQELSENKNVALYILKKGAEFCGFFELNFKPLPASADLAFFGLYENYIGKGLGKKLLSHAINILQKSQPDSITINTCDLDNAAALYLYKSFGFIVQDIVKKEITDPRTNGLIPEHLKLPDHYGKANT